MGCLCTVVELQNISYCCQQYKSKLYICSSVHRNFRLKKSNEMQQYADIYLLLNYSTCFGPPTRPSSGVRKTVFSASGADHTVREASFFKRDQISPYFVTFVEADLYQRLQLQF